MRRAHAKTVGNDFGTRACGALVDHEVVAHAVQRVREDRIFIPERERLLGNGFVVEECDEFTERLKPVGQRRIGDAAGLQRISRCRERAIRVRPGNDRCHVAGNQLDARTGDIQHVEDRPAGLAFMRPGRAVRIARFVVDDRVTARCGAD